MEMVDSNKHSKSCENAGTGKVTNECPKSKASFGSRVASEAIRQMACDTDDVVDFIFMCNEAGKDPIDVVESICRRNGFHYTDEKEPEDPEKACLFNLVKDVVDSLSASQGDSEKIEDETSDDNGLEPIVRALVDFELKRILNHVFL